MAKNSDGSSFYYFEHRAGSRNDLKILKLDEILGENNGYALFFKSLEVMLEMEKPFLRYDSSLIARAMSISMKEYREFLDACISIGLFEIDEEDNIYSPSFLKWLNKKQSIAERGSKGGKATQAKFHSEPEPEIINQSEDREEKQNQKIKIEQESIAEIVSFWNENAKKCRCIKITSDIQKAIQKRLKEFSIEEIKQAIKNYQLVVQHPKSFFKYTWNLQEFLTRQCTSSLLWRHRPDTGEIWMWEIQRATSFLGAKYELSRLLYTK